MTIRIEHTVQVWWEDGSYVARATPLDVMSCGMTPEEARRNLSEAVALFFKTVSAHGTLVDVLEECGYRRVNDEWRAPTLLSSETVTQAISA
jgi:predicted RNase H-like HicB family nuclease